MSNNAKLQALTESLAMVLDRIKYLIDTKEDKGGIVSVARRLETPRNISLGGDGSGSSLFDGSSNAVINMVLSNTGVVAGEYGSSTKNVRVTVDSKGRIVSIDAVDSRIASLQDTGVVRLSNAVDSVSESTAATPLAVKTAYDLAAAALPAVQKGAPNGLATLDASGQVPAEQLPSYVDDVLEYPQVSEFPVVGERGKLYLDTSNNNIYRWTGSSYIWVNSSVGAADTAVKLATARSINGVPFDGSQDITLSTVNLTGNQTITGTKTFSDPIAGNVTGKSSSADKLTAQRNIAISGAVTGSGNFDGTSDLTINVSMSNSGVAAGIYGDEGNVPVLTVDAQGRLSDADVVPLPKASTSKEGIVRLSTAVNSTSTVLGATASAVKQAYDLASGAIRANTIGAPNGIAALDANGQVPASQLPSYVDDVLEFDTLADFPATGETGKIYVSSDNGNIYRWSGSIYIQIGVNAASADVALKLANVRNISMTGDGSWSVGFDGSGNRSAEMVLAETGVSEGVYGDANNIPRVTVDAKGRVIDITTIARPTHATEAEKLSAAREIELSGNVTGSALFDGTADINISVTLTNTGVAAGSYGKVTVDSQGRVTAGGNLAEADIPALSITKTTGLQAALDSKFNISNLSSAINSTSVSTAATSAAVKSAYDLAAAALPASQKGVANGVASLDANGQVPASQLPSYVDDVLEFSALANFPTTGESGKIYVAIDTGSMYRWTGTVYIQIGGNVGAAESALKLTTARNIAMTGDASWSVNFDGSGNVSGTMSLASTGVTPGVYSKMTVDAKGRITGAAALTASDIPLLNQNTSGNAATASKLATARTLTVGNTAKEFDGSVNLSWSVAEIGAAAASHTHNYLPLGGGNVAGVTSFTNTSAATSATTGALRVSGGVGVGGDVWAAGDVTAFSDIRLKKDIEVIEDALERIFQLRGVTYTRTDGGMAGRRQTGLIAQDVQEAMPEAVKGGVTSEEDPNGYLGVAYGNLVGLLVEGIKELSGKVDDLQHQINKLRS